MLTDMPNPRLWQLISPALPIGAFAWSQGLETVVDHGVIHDRNSALAWMRGVLRHGLCCTDLPLLQRLYHAWDRDDQAQLEYWNAFALACRESRELLHEDQQMGKALARVLMNLDIDAAAHWHRREEASYLTLFALAGIKWDIGLRDLACGWLWAWCENQTAAAIKLVPLGQSDGQWLLSSLIEEFPGALSRALETEDEDVGAGLPGLAMASARHETQYTRLFRS